MRKIELFTRFLKGFTASKDGVIPSSSVVTVSFESVNGKGWAVVKKKGVPPIDHISISGVAPSAVVGMPYNFTPSVIGGSGVKLFSFSGVLPDGLSFNTSIGSIGGIPSSSGEFSGISITVTDSTGSATLTGISISVSSQVEPLTIDGVPTYGTVGIPYSFTPSVSGGSGLKSFSLSGSLPSGLSFSSSTGEVFGVPRSAGVSSGVSITVSDQSGSAILSSLSFSIVAAPVSLSLETPVTQSMIDEGKLIEAYGFSRLVPGFSSPTLRAKNPSDTGYSLFGFNSETGNFEGSGLQQGAIFGELVGQAGTGVNLTPYGGAEIPMFVGGALPRMATSRDESTGHLSRRTDVGGIGLNLAGLYSLITEVLPVKFSESAYEVHLLWSPNNRKRSSNDSTDPNGGNNTRENIACFGTNSANQMIAYMGGGTGSDFCRMQAGGQMNQTTGKGASGPYRFNAKSQHVTSYVMERDRFQEIESGKVTKSIALNANTSVALGSGSMDANVLGIGSVFSSSTTAAQSANNRGDIVFSAAIITRMLGQEERLALQRRLSAIGQPHLMASADEVISMFDEIVDHRKVNSSTGRVSGEKGKLTTDFNISSGLFEAGYVIPSVGGRGIRSTSTASSASYDSTDNYFSDAIEGTVLRLSFWEGNPQNTNLAQDLSMSNGGDQTGSGYSLLLGYHHSIPAFGTKPSNLIDTRPRVGTRLRADLSSFGSSIYDGINQTIAKYNFWCAHLAMSYGESFSDYVWTRLAWENQDPSSPYQLDAPVFSPVADGVQYPFKPNQLQLHIATFSPPEGYNPQNPDPAMFLMGRSESYVSGAGIDPIGHLDGSIAKATRTGIRHASPDHRVKSVQYQYAFQGTRCLWAFAKRRLTEEEIGKVQVNLQRVLDRLAA